jgi:hypothetical protein
MKKTMLVRCLILCIAIGGLAGCGDGSDSNSVAPLRADNVNLIFVTSPDLAYQTPGDVDPDTANLTAQGLQRSLMMATYLKNQVLGGENVDKIYTISPMSHLQTANNYPDMSAIGFIQQFALLNQTTLPVDATDTYTANTFPIDVSYTQAGVPIDAVGPSTYCPDCTGLDFNNADERNSVLVSGIIASQTPGYYVFCAPWETVSALLTTINTRYGYGFDLPSDFMGSNYVYAISIPSSGNAGLKRYNSELNPPDGYPVLPSPVGKAACSHSLQPYFRLVLTGGVDGVVIPPDINRNSKVYIVRHAEAHPDPGFRFDNGNYVGAGQWRALSLADTLKGRIYPDVVYSIDPAEMWYFNGAMNVSYVRPSLTILPYVIANNLPYRLAAGLSLGSPYKPTDETVAGDTRKFFFFSCDTCGNFSDKIVLVAWESGHIKPFLNALISSYGGNDIPLLPETWPSQDYDTIWTVSLDAQGNLTIDNELCEGIDSETLPKDAPQF